MTWINRYKMIWRVGVLMLWLVALAGPWGYDSIHVPGEYECNEPWFRYSEVMCATTVPGGQFFAMVSGEFTEFIRAFLFGETVVAGLSYLVLFIAIAVLLLAPVYNTLLSLVAGKRRRQLPLNALAWLPSLLVGLLIGLATFFELNTLLWGTWLLAGLAAMAIWLEWRSMAVFQTDLLMQKEI